MPFFKNRKTRPTYGILLVGDPNVGKTRLLKCYRSLKGPSIQDGPSSLTCVYVVPPAFEGMGASFEIIIVVGSNIHLEPDTPFFQETLSRCMAVILCYDVSNRESFESLGEWIDVVERKKEGMLRYLVACKCDKTYNVEREEAEKFARDHRLESFTETSAITKNGIDDLFENVMERIFPWQQQLELTKITRPESTLPKSREEVRDLGQPSRPDVKVLVVGDSGVGKTTFLKRFILVSINDWRLSVCVTNVNRKLYL